MVTHAPELDGGIDAVRALVASGVVAAVGHTEATYDTVRAAVVAAASMGTHLFNAMPSLHHREPGPVAALLESDAYIEPISDGVHLHPATLRLAARAKPGRSVLVTDAMAAAAGADGDYRLGTMEVEVRDGSPASPAPARSRGRPSPWTPRCATRSTRPAWVWPRRCMRPAPQRHRRSVSGTWGCSRSAAGPTWSCSMPTCASSR